MKKAAIFLILASLFTQFAQAQWAGGGTQTDPYQITSPADLTVLSTYVMNQEGKILEINESS